VPGGFDCSLCQERLLFGRCCCDVGWAVSTNLQRSVLRIGNSRTQNLDDAPPATRTSSCICCTRSDAAAVVCPGSNRAKACAALGAAPNRTQGSEIEVHGNSV